MSDEARNYVKQHSPFRGSTFFIHYALADIANAQHDYQIWVSEQRLMEEWRMGKTTVYKAYKELIEAGYLRVIQKAARGQRVRYQFEFPDLEGLKNFPEAVTNLGTNEIQIPQSDIQIPQSEHVHLLIKTEVEQKLLAAPASQRPRDELFDALVTGLNLDVSELTPMARKKLNVAVKELRSIDADPMEIALRIKAYREKWPTASLTEMALVKHWAFLAGPRPVKDPGFTQDELARWNETLAYIVNPGHISTPRRSMSIIARVGLPELKKMTVLEARDAFIAAYRASLLKE